MIRGRVEKIKRPSLGIDVRAGIHNRFDVEVLRAGEIVQRATGYNIILNQLWPVIVYSGNWFAYIAYGSGTGELMATRTNLFTHVGSKIATNANIDTSQWASSGIVAARKQITIAAGELTGTTLREVGIAYGSSSNQLATHALLKDMSGNNVSITIGALDVVTIYATVYLRISSDLLAGTDGLAFGSGAVSTANSAIRKLLGAASYDWGNANYGSNYIVAYRASDAASISEKQGHVSYNAGNKKIFIRHSLAAGVAYRIGVGDLNPSGGSGWRKIELLKNYQGSTGQGLELIFPNTIKPYCTLTDEPVGTGTGSQTVFALDFGWVRNDGTLVVKVDGVEQASGVTCNYGAWPANLTFSTAPADGAAITATYRTESICKDTNHVVDIECTITLNEYVPE